MKKNYVRPAVELHTSVAKCAILAGSNYLDNGTDEDAGAKIDSSWDLWNETED